MNISEERMRWKQDSANVNEYVNDLVLILKDKGAAPAGFMAIDLVFRAYLQWLHSAQISQQDPNLIRNAVLNMIDIMIIEASARISGVDEEGDMISKARWIRDLVVDLLKVLDEDVKDLEGLQ